MAKDLIRYHFDFVIMEYLSELRSTVAFSKAFHSSLVQNKEMEHTDNSGLFNPASVGSDHVKMAVTKYLKHPWAGSVMNESRQYASHSSYRRLQEDTATEHSGVGFGIDADARTRGVRRRLTSYRKGMPESVLSYLEKDNAEDLELYQFALQEFERRSAEEGWVPQKT